MLKRFINWLFEKSSKEDTVIVPRHIKCPINYKPVPKSPKSESIPDICQFPKCKNKLTGFDYKQCKYCQGHFCMKHASPAESHYCKGDLISIPKEGTISYGKN